MNLFKRRIGFAVALVAGMLLCGVASATPVTMNFDGLTPGTWVHTYYNGDCSVRHHLFRPPSKVDCNGPGYGVVWKNAHVRGLFEAPSEPNYAGPGLISDGAITMSIADGFDTGFYFSYTTFAGFLTGTATVYNGTSAVDHVDLSGTGIYCNGHIPCWRQAGLGFDGVATSIVFKGSSGFLKKLAFGIDDVTIGATLPVPEPAELGVFGLGVLLIGGFVGLRRRKSSVAAGSL